MIVSGWRCEHCFPQNKRWGKTCNWLALIHSESKLSNHALAVYSSTIWNSMLFHSSPLTKSSVLRSSSSLGSRRRTSRYSIPLRKSFARPRFTTGNQQVLWFYPGGYGYKMQQTVSWANVQVSSCLQGSGSKNPKNFNRWGNLQETLVFPMDFRWLFPSSAGPEEIALRARDEANAVGWHWNHGEILGVNGAMEQMLHAEGTVGHI